MSTTSTEAQHHPRHADDARPADASPGRTTHAPHTPWAHALRTAVLAAVAVCLILLAFAWPSVTAKPQHLPVAVVGTTEQIQQLTAKAPDGMLDIHTVGSRDDAISQIRNRSVYGAVILPAAGAPEILVASAASPVASTALTQLGAGIQKQIDQQAIAGLTDAVKKMQAALAAHQPPVTDIQPTTTAPTAPAAVPTVVVTDVVPLSSDDPRGTGLAVAGLPLAMGGMVGGVLISLLVSGAWRRLAAVLGYGVLGGLGLAGILQGWFHVLQGDYWANSLAVGLGLAATAAIIAGLSSLIGQAGVAVGAVITMFIGNPLSALTQPKEFLPAPWGDVGQWFVPGASGTLLRDLSYFPDASTAFPWLVLGGWAVLGVVLIATGHFRNQGAVAEV
ncbi:MULTISPECIES: ABC transporter permease [Arthrobacter]|uniref:ABC transporter permease n=2 Tax=Arthrobacter TaxID=1663 RepID=A0ABU9KQA8_9MICC|nr:ABC transporter permease [Arthrobacter sp. YJM1]MDP5228479.1 ABC transporter permease [Arthrobacter sp. YJM1]